MAFHFKFPKCSPCCEIIFPKFLQQITKNGEKTCCFSRYFSTLGNRKKYFPNLWFSWYSMTSSQNVPICVKLSCLKFYDQFPGMGKKTCCFSRYFPTSGKREIYFPNLGFSWYSITSSQNVPISVKLSSLKFYNKFPRMEKNPIISQSWVWFQNLSQNGKTENFPVNIFSGRYSL